MMSVTLCVVINATYLNKYGFGDNMESSTCSLVSWLAIFHSYCIQIYQLLPLKVENSLQCAVAFIKLSSQSQYSHFPLMQY